MKKLTIFLMLFMLAMPSALAIASKTCNSSYNYPHTHVNGQPADATKENANNTGINSNARNACADIDLAAGLADANTFAGANTYSAVQTYTLAPVFNAGVTFGSDATDGITNSFVVIDADNAGAEADSSVRWQRGSTNANDSRLEWDATNDQFEFTTEGTTLAPVLVAECDATSEACPYESVVRDTGTQTVAGAKTWSDANTFTSAVTLSTTCSTANHACPKTYIDTADSAITAGGSSEGSGAPVGSCTNGGKYYDVATNTAPIEYYCKGSDSMTWVKVDSDSQDITPWISTSTDIDFTGVPPSSATDSLLGLGIDVASGSANGNFIGINKASFTGNFIQAEVAGVDKFVVDATGAVTVAGTISGVTDPTTAQQAATKNYVDTNGITVPTDLIGCQLWLKASDIAGSDGTAVSAWDDASGNARNFVQATGANQPTLKTGANGINSQNVVRFDGTTDFLTSSATVENIIDGSAGTAIIVAKIGSALATDAILCDSGANLVYGINATGWRVTSEAETENVAVSVSTSYILWAKHDGTNFYTRINRTVWPAGSGDGIVGTLTGTLILGDRTGASEFFTGDIAEIIVFDRVLDEGEATLMRTYLNNKYAIY